MRWLALLTLIPLLSGCVEDSFAQDGEQGTETDWRESRKGVVLLEEDFEVVSKFPAHLWVNVGEGTARNVVLEIMQDSGAMPNLRINLVGCGKLDPPASAGWEAYALCDEMSGGEHELLIYIPSETGIPYGSGRVLVRADVPA